jgi:hypothetical protein
MMGRKVRAIRLATALLACAAGGVALAALEWPLPPAAIAATFGTPAKGRMVTGVALAASGEIVRSAGEGELVFAADEGIWPSGLPSALGAFLVVEHAGDMAAVYAHLDSASTSDNQRDLRAGDALGAAGASGWAEGEGLLLQIYDRKKGNWVNPLLILPRIDDKKPPVIRSLALRRGGAAQLLGETRLIKQGVYALCLSAADPSGAKWTAGPLAPLSMRVSIDGTLVASGVFDIARASNGDILFFSDSPRPGAALRDADGGFVLAERLLTRGKVLFEAVVEDAAGNRRSASWSIAIE